jgi:aldehyde:ferredoxin oxidoreductase
MGEARMSSYTGEFLRVDLTTRRISFEGVPQEVQRMFVGGRGFGIKFLYDETAPGIDPLGPKNKLFLLTGPLGGTKAQSCARWLAYTKSPLTGTIMRAVGGGDFGVWMKWAGLDFIIIEGKAEKPVYLFINDEGCEIRDAGDLWGQNTTDTQNSLAKRHGSDVRTACIGPAGEKLVLYSTITSGRRTASRGGVGTVMGSKNLKAVAIKAKRKKLGHDETVFDRLAKQQVKEYHEEGPAAAMTEYFSQYGTGSIRRANTKGYFPVRNFQTVVLDGWEKLTNVEYGALTRKHTGCYNCLLHCGKERYVPDGRYAGHNGEGPEYETIHSFTGPIDSTDIGLTIAANARCDELGLDTMSSGYTIGFAFELFERGLITTTDTDGLELTWGNHSVVLPLLDKIAKREGIGGLLSLGTKRMADLIGRGSADFAPHVKGLELAAYDPRAVKGMGFGMAISNAGGTHNYAYAFQEIFEIPIPRAVDPFAEEGKAEIVKFNQEMGSISDSAITCFFPFDIGIFKPGTIGKLLAAATGEEAYSELDELLRVGERICNLERAYNIREGFGRKDDTLPKRILNEPISRGPAEGQRIEDLEGFLDEFYRICGWQANGVPRPDHLKELGLESAARDMREVSRDK